MAREYKTQTFSKNKNNNDFGTTVARKISSEIVCENTAATSQRYNIYYYYFDGSHSSRRRCVPSKVLENQKNKKTSLKYLRISAWSSIFGGRAARKLFEIFFYTAPWKMFSDMTRKTHYKTCYTLYSERVLTEVSLLCLPTSKTRFWLTIIIINWWLSNNIGTIIILGIRFFCFPRNIIMFIDVKTSRCT